MTAHVVAAVLAGGCDVIVTYNVRDFPAEALSPLGLRALQPDDFLMEVAAADSDGQWRRYGPWSPPRSTLLAP